MSHRINSAAPRLGRSLDDLSVGAALHLSIAPSLFGYSSAFSIFSHVLMVSCSVLLPRSAIIVGLDLHPHFLMNLTVHHGKYVEVALQPSESHAGGRAHDLTVAQPVSDTHLGLIVPNEVLAHMWANILLLVILFTIFSQIYIYKDYLLEISYILLEHRGALEHAAGSGKRAEAEGGPGRGARCRITLVSRYCTRKHGAS
jgi:hypothetical protein